LLRANYISRRSKHNLGVAVDVGLYERESGEPLPMGTGFDVFSAQSHTKNAHGTPLRNRLILKRAMQERGFRACRTEWWHFDFPDTEARALDVRYECQIPSP
jgi:D-alanyl-D-alanine dipeptidase